ncbi:hypothetical protein [Rickettsia endosymbiont of Orchestes rusci]|uniref:hypothetical protein n=1 Tax=Rickettsia endosymbiont of Orchestes rusci TaxID=3066250 RepID=UPI00313E7B53
MTVIHELSNFQFQTEQAGIIKSFAAMKKSKKYLAEITEALNSELPQEREKWWHKEK